jgi:hypothetical protein
LRKYRIIYGIIWLHGHAIRVQAPVHTTTDQKYGDDFVGYSRGLAVKSKRCALAVTEDGFWRGQKIRLPSRETMESGIRNRKSW